MRERAATANPGVQEQFCVLYRETLPAVYGFLFIRVGGNRELAEDLTADTYAAAVQKFRQGDGDEVTSSWLKTVAKRRLIDHWRRKAVSERTAGASRPSNGDLNPDIADQDAVVRALGALALDEQRALVLQHIEGYSVKDVAEILGRSEKATESLLGRARTAFRAAYKEADHG